ncbi:hypothetical protein HD553DRAFT_16961 [Filobasidium floriforme]|uniref:uncharacterized protein n=1 Tax=Filobasidium floriforme TaxID=5210 RepID=UPI001E8E8A65|nr:uncharacterized protein HD553DRAFT_16961 [Filobasidium floriforme]KAH8090809.1 hypothetical protein HD553DRAFT_16961 [Filobasidium floriforme]
MSSDMSGNVVKTPTGLKVNGSEKLDYNFHYVSPVFDISHAKLAETYKPWGRVLIVLDKIVAGIYQKPIEEYFAHYKVPAHFKLINGGELNKNMDTFEEIVDFLDASGLVRQEPLLVVGGGLVTDVAGYVCASYRRSTPFIRVPTTLIGLIDASVSIKVGLNHKKLKNRLGAYFAPVDTYLDFSFLKTLPEGQVRNGTAELIKICTVSEKRIWDLLVKHGKQLVETGYGFKNDDKELKAIGDDICKSGIEEMLRLESGNLHELMLDRVIAFGHSWSPTCELGTSPLPLRHGHAIMIDMAYSITLAHSRGMLTDAMRDEWFTLATQVGLSIDHPQFDAKLLQLSTRAIEKTRNGKQRFAVPDGEFGKCTFLNDVSDEELAKVLETHKKFVADRFPNYKGQDAYVDSGDLGEDVEKYIENKKNGGETLSGGCDHSHGNGTAPSLKKVDGSAAKAAVAAGAAVNSNGQIVNGQDGTA